ncbi:MAG: BON domain-containing protein [Granulosicoccus sp.]
MAINTRIQRKSTQHIPGVMRQYALKRPGKTVRVSRHRQVMSLAAGLVLLLGIMMAGNADATLRAMECGSGHSFWKMPVVDGVVVSVHDGVATINGQIRTPQERYSVYQAAANTAGVSHVIDLTTVANVE